MKNSCKFLPLALVLVSPLAQAGNQGLYLGGGLGFGSLEPAASFSEREAGFAGRGFLGYNFNEYLGIETNYAALGSRKFVSSIYPHNTTKFRLDAITLVGKAYLPLAYESPISLYGLFGGAQMRDHTTSNSWFASNRTNLTYVPTAGFGMGYDFSQRFSVSAELSGFGKSKESGGYRLPYSGLGTVSLGYRF